MQPVTEGAVDCAWNCSDVGEYIYPCELLCQDKCKTHDWLYCFNRKLTSATSKYSS